MPCIECESLCEYLEDRRLATSPRVALAHSFALLAVALWTLARKSPSSAPLPEQEAANGQALL